MLSQVFGDRRHAWAFWLGCLLVTVGVVLHLPMYWMSHGMGFHLAAWRKGSACWPPRRRWVSPPPWSGF